MLPKLSAFLFLIFFVRLQTCSGCDHLHITRDTTNVLDHIFTSLIVANDGFDQIIELRKIGDHSCLYPFTAATSHLSYAFML